MDRELQLQLIRDVLEHVRHGTTQQQEGEDRSPVERYLDPQRLQLERRAVLRRRVRPLIHASTLEEPHSFITADLAGLPVVLTRDADGRARAFLNVCRHRGSQVVESISGCAERWSCPYHGWTYRSDGTLASVPHGKGFPTLDKDASGLQELPAVETLGFVWAVGTPLETPTSPLTPESVAAELGPFATELAALELSRSVSFRAMERTWRANWKLLVEGGLEAYHFRVAHADTIAPLFLDNVALLQWHGGHVRAVLPKRTLAELDDDALSKARLHDHANVLYSVFPSDALLVQSDHVAWISFRAEAVDRTRIRIEMLIPEEPATPKAARYWERNHELLMRTLDEDFHLAEGIQRGLASGANATLRFGRFEHGLTRFHEYLESVL